MKRELAEKLAQKLKFYCPVDTGALRASISGVQGNPKQWLITIGNDDASISGTPTVQYAALLNFSQTIKGVKNKHYHWVNKAVAEWIRENKLLLNLESEKDFETEELEDGIGVDIL